MAKLQKNIRKDKNYLKNYLTSKSYDNKKYYVLYSDDKLNESDFIRHKRLFMTKDYATKFAKKMHKRGYNVIVYDAKY